MTLSTEFLLVIKGLIIDLFHPEVDDQLFCLGGVQEQVVISAPLTLSSVYIKNKPARFISCLKLRCGCCGSLVLKLLCLKQ